MANAATQAKVPGMIYPTVNALPPGATSARDAAILAQQTSAAKQAALNQTVHGGYVYNKHKKRHAIKNFPHKLYATGGNATTAPAAAPIAVPQFTMQYPAASQTTVNDISANNAKISVDAASNRSLDQKPAATGGKRTRTRQRNVKRRRSSSRRRRRHCSRKRRGGCKMHT